MSRTHRRTPRSLVALLFALLAPASPSFADALDEVLDATAPPARAGDPLADPESGSPALAAEPPPGDLAARVAEAFVGTPYALGQKSSKAIDCSGLMQLSYDAAGVPLPRTAAEQSAAGATTSLAEAAPGDLLFYRFRRHSPQLHVAMYVGSGRAVHASIKHGVVRVVNILAGPWPAHLVKIVRPGLEASALHPHRSAG